MPKINAQGIATNAALDVPATVEPEPASEPAREEQSSPGNSSTPSTGKTANTFERNSGPRKPARTTGSH